MAEKQRLIVENGKFKAGFVTLTGAPNAGKSTLLNRLAGGKLSIVSSKPQTTRQNIFAIHEAENCQAVFVDTPGFLTPAYGLHKAMLSEISRACAEDGDVICMVAEPRLPLDKEIELCGLITQTNMPLILLINKTDTVKNPAELQKVREAYEKAAPFKHVFLISALKNQGIKEFQETVLKLLPEHEPYFPKGQWTDRWERFYAAEFVREQIFNIYQKEVPYCCAVNVEAFDDKGLPTDRIRAVIYVERESQKPIIIGKGGQSIKRLREAAQKEINAFLGRHVRLELVVEVRTDWRNNKEQLERFGYLF